LTTSLRLLKCLSLLVVCSVPELFCTETDWIQVPVAIHLDSDVSGGELSIEQIVRRAGDNGIRGVIITDHDRMEIEYGVFPFRNIIKRVKQRPSIASVGFEEYFKRIASAGENDERVVTITGAEVTPFYDWAGSPLSRNMRLNNWHRHLLTIGMEQAEDYEHLPTISNGVPRVFSPAILGVNVIFALLVFFGYKLARYSKLKKVTVGQQVMAYWTRPHKLIGIIMMAIFFLMLADNFPYTKKVYDQYHGDRGPLPYQRVIDYVNERGGLTFWAHPEVGFDEILESIEISTKPYPRLVEQTRNHDGFAVFPDGMRTIGRIGGMWDELLAEYCVGRRDRPIWAIAELSFEAPRHPNAMRELLNVLLVEEDSKDGMLDALKHGRMYAVRDFAADFLRLDEFTISGVNTKGSMGEKVLCASEPIITVALSVDNDLTRDLKVSLVRNGSVSRSWRLNTGQLAERFSDDFVNETACSSYRLIVENGGRTILVTNPIFVEKGNVPT